MSDAPPHPSQKTGTGLPLAMICIAMYVLLILIGYSVFRSEAAMVRGNEMSRDEAFFTVVNAATLTGFQQSDPTNIYLAPGQWMILLLVAGGSLCSLILGGMAVRRIARLPYTDGQIAITSLAMVFGSIVFGGVLLADSTRPLMETPAAMLQAVSALGNSGLFIGSLPAISQWQTHVILMPLAVIGGLGAPVVLDIRYRITRKQPISDFTHVVLVTTALVYLAGVILVFLSRAGGPSTALLLSASVDAINSRTTGLPFEYAHAFSRPLQWIYLLLMLVGAASGGTGGGIKVNTLAALVRGVIATFRGQVPLRSHALSIAWIAIYGTTLLFFLWWMLTDVPQMPADRLLFLTASALGNVGLSHDPVPSANELLNSLVFVMLAGRFFPLVMLWWVASTSKEAEMPIG